MTNTIVKSLRQKCSENCPQLYLKFEGGGVLGDMLTDSLLLVNKPHKIEAILTRNIEICSMIALSHSSPGFFTHLCPYQPKTA